MFAPIMLNFTGLKTLVIGASKVGIRRAKKLSEYGCDVTLESLDFPAIKSLELFKIRKKKFEINDLTGFDIVIAATNNSLLNQLIVKESNKLGILSNSITNDINEKFQIPSSFNKDDLWISVSTSGHFPFLSKFIKEKIKKSFNRNFQSRFRLLNEARITILNDKSSEEKNDEFIKLLNFSNKELRNYNDLKINKNKKVIRVGTRGSQLAQKQADLILNKLEKIFPNYIFKKIIIKTTGDKKNKNTIQELGGKNVFVDNFEEALLNYEIDIAVHSAKDINYNLISQTEVPILHPDREDSEDVLLYLKNKPVQNLVRIGTGSIRRQKYLEFNFPNSKIVEIRGNIDTRISKLKSEEYDGIIVAKAGLNRLGLSEDKLLKEGIKLKTLKLTPAPLQGLLAFQIRKNDSEIRDLLEAIKNPYATLEGFIERSLQLELNANCLIPLGINTKYNNREIQLSIFLVNANSEILELTRNYPSLKYFNQEKDNIVKELRKFLEINE